MLYRFHTRILSAFLILASGASGFAAPVVLPQEKGILHIGLPNGHAFSYDTKQFRALTTWQGPAAEPVEHPRPLHILSNPWQQRLKSLKGNWKGFEIVGDDVIFRYSMTGKDGQLHITERITIDADQAVLSFTVEHPEKPFDVNYRLYQRYYRLVKTTGQPRGRGQVQYLKPGQKDYSITLPIDATPLATRA